MEGVLIESLVRERTLQLDVLAGQGGLRRRIAVPRIQKPALALAGLVALFFFTTIVRLGGAGGGT